MSSRKKILSVTIVAVVAVILVTAIVLACIYFFSPKSNPEYVAHRGSSQSYLGNTEKAFRAAADMGYYGIETDVRKTKDGFYVCNHDETVKYADGTEKEVSLSTFAELMAKPLKNDKSADEVYLCTFENYLEICKAGGKVAVIELKEDFSLESLREILQIVDVVYDRAHVSIISFYFDALKRVKAEDPSVGLQYLSETKNDPTFDRCLEEGISISVRQSILTKKMVDAFHEANLRVNVWTVNKRFDLNVVRIKGVDYVTTDVFSKD